MQIKVGSLLRLTAH